MIKACRCANTYQDTLYGKGMRIHTEAKDGTPRCTVCGPKARKIQRLDLHVGEYPKFEAALKPR